MGVNEVKNCLAIFGHRIHPRVGGDLVGCPAPAISVAKQGKFNG
jgi:hypothetical protein